MAPEPEIVRVLSVNSHVRFAPQVPLCARRLSVKQKRNAISDRILVVFIFVIVYLRIQPTKVLQISDICKRIATFLLFSV